MINEVHKKTTWCFKDQSFFFLNSCGDTYKQQTLRNVQIVL